MPIQMKLVERHEQIKLSLVSVFGAKVDWKESFYVLLVILALSIFVKKKKNAYYNELPIQLIDHPQIVVVRRAQLKGDE